MDRLPSFLTQGNESEKVFQLPGKGGVGLSLLPVCLLAQSWDRLCFRFPEPSSQALACLPPLPRMREARHWKRREPSTSPESTLTCLYLWEDEKQRYKETLWGSNGERDRSPQEAVQASGIGTEQPRGWARSERRQQPKSQESKGKVALVQPQLYCGHLERD